MEALGAGDLSARVEAIKVEMAHDVANGGRVTLQSGNLLTGSLLWVTWPEIIKTGIIYLVLGVAHWFLRERFLVTTAHRAC